MVVPRQYRGHCPVPCPALDTPEYGISRVIVFSNERKIYEKKGVTYLPIYYCMFLNDNYENSDVI